MRSFKELHEGIKKGDIIYVESLEKAKTDSNGDQKEFTKLAAGFTGKSKPGLKKCCIFKEILDNLKTV